MHKRHISPWQKLTIPPMKKPSTAITTPNLEAKLTKQHETMDTLIILHLPEYQLHP